MKIKSIFCRSTQSDVFCKNKIFGKDYRKTLVQESLFLKKLQDEGLQLYLKRSRCIGFFLWNFYISPEQLFYSTLVNRCLWCNWILVNLAIFNRDLNRDCLVYMFSLYFSGSKYLINLRRQFRVRKTFSCTWNFPYTSFCGICSLLILCLKWLFRKCATYVLGCPFAKSAH